MTARRRPRRFAMPSPQTRMLEYRLDRVRSARADWYRTARIAASPHLEMPPFLTSQNAPQLLVSKKCDLANSIGSALACIEWPFALQSDFMKLQNGSPRPFGIYRLRRPPAAMRKFPGKLIFFFPNPFPLRLPRPGLDACGRVVFRLLSHVTDDKYSPLLGNVDLRIVSVLLRKHRLQKKSDRLRVHFANGLWHRVSVLILQVGVRALMTELHQRPGRSCTSHGLDRLEFCRSRVPFGTQYRGVHHAPPGLLIGSVREISI